MADKNEPGGGVVPSARAEVRREIRSDLKGTIIYVAAILIICTVIVGIVLLA